MRSIGVKGIVGAVLLILGASWLLLIVLNFTITETVINTAFVLEPGEKYGPREDGTVYWTRGFPVLTGNVSVEGGGINFTVRGHIEDLMESTFVDSYFNFTIGPPTSDGYWFTFDNTGGNATSHVEFVLNETLTESLTFRIVRSFGPVFPAVSCGCAVRSELLYRCPSDSFLPFGVYSQGRRERAILRLCTKTLMQLALTDSRYLRVFSPPSRLFLNYLRPARCIDHLRQLLAKCSSAFLSWDNLTLTGVIDMQASF
jgi:hypothetical protein